MFVVLTNVVYVLGVFKEIGVYRLVVLTNLAYVLGVDSVVFIGLLCLQILCMYWVLTV